MATNQKIYTSLDSTNDVVTNVKKKFSEAMWTGGVGTLTEFFTSSAEPSPQYYHEIYNESPLLDTAQPQFSVAYGNYYGSGSLEINVDANDTSISPSRITYLQYRNILIADNSSKFEFNGDSADDIFIINLNRARYKEQIDPGNWELVLDDGNSGTMTLIDNYSESPQKQIGEGGEYWNIVSGSIASGVYDSSIVYGYVYPAYGLIIFDAEKITSGAVYFQVDRASNTDANNHGEFFNLIKTGASFKARNKQYITSTYYFVRVKNKEYNYSTNPTFTTGDVGDINSVDMIENDSTTYITSVGLYNDANELLAIAKISKPIKKTFEVEQNFQVKLDF